MSAVLRTAARLLPRAGPLAASALVLGACVTPPKPLPVAPEPLPATPPQVSVWTPSLFPGTGLPSLYFSTSRAGYATVFEVDRNGRVRVVYPRSPRDAGRVEPGRTYSATSAGISTDRTFLTAATRWQRLPFLFVVVSDGRQDLSDWGKGRSWQSQVRTDGVDADEIIDAVATRVTAGSGTPYTSDYVYLGPRLNPREAMLAASCARFNTDPQDYWYYRDLWAVFTPSDPTFGAVPVFAFGPYLTWASGNLWFAFDRMQWATAAFQGACASPFQPQYRNALLWAAWRPWGQTVATGGSIARPVVPPVREQPVDGARPTALRVPRTPRELENERLSSGDQPRTSGGSVEARAALERGERPWARPSERLTRSVEMARPGGLAVEPLDRPRPADSPWRGAGGGTSGGADRFGTSSTAMDAEPRRRGTPRGGSWGDASGGGFGGSSGPRGGADRVADGPRSAPQPSAQPRFEPRPADQPHFEPRSAPVSTGGGGESSRTSVSSAKNSGEPH